MVTSLVSMAQFITQVVLVFIMTHIEQRSVIKFLTAEGIGGAEIHQRLFNVNGTSVYKISNIKNLRQLFRLGRKSVEDDPRSGRSSDVITPKIIEKIEQTVFENRRLKKKEIARMCRLSETNVFRVLQVNLHMSKVSA